MKGKIINFADEKLDDYSMCDLLRKLSEVDGISGHEHKVSQLLQNEMTEYCDEIIYDNLGSIFAIKRSKSLNSKKVMVSAHMDEVGFIVKDIREDGLMHIQQIGGWWDQTLLGKQAILTTHQGDRIPGIIASIPVHNLTTENSKSIVEIKDMLFDVGLDSYEKVKESNICPGDMIVLCTNYHESINPNRLISKAWDNRAGCAAIIKLLQLLKDCDLPFDLYVGATTQEEVGGRGMRTISNTINPDLAFVVDVSACNDTYYPKKYGFLGKGILFRTFDYGMVPNYKLFHYAKDICDKYKINYQYFISNGTTDSSIVHLSGKGVPTFNACICARYIHCGASIIDISDVHRLIYFLKNTLLDLNDELIEDFKKL